MSTLDELGVTVRSKNAGPFRLTIDLFCADEATYHHVASELDANDIARAFDVPAAQISRHDLPSLHVVKFSLPRPGVQGSARDRDMHGAQWAVLVSDLSVASPVSPRADR